MSEAPKDLSRLRIDRQRPRVGVGHVLRPGLWVVGGALLIGAALYLLLQGQATPAVYVVASQLQGGAGGSTGITANGYVVARIKASVSSKITGRLEYLGVEEGSVLREGEIIARLESDDYAAALAQRQAELAMVRAGRREAEAERDQLRRDLKRVDELALRDLLSRQSAEQLSVRLATAEARLRRVAAQVEAAEAAVRVARADLENTRIRAPFPGTVLRKDAEVGEVVAPAVTGGGLTRGAVVTMADLETLEVEVDVNEAYIARVRHGQPAAIKLDAYPDTAFGGEVRQIVPTADRQKATVLVKVGFLYKDPRILPEMGATVEFLANAQEVRTTSVRRVFVPAAAVRDDAGRQVVWLVRAGRFEVQSVEAGPVTGEHREIRSGLRGGELVVVDGGAGLKSGTRVNVIRR